MRFPTLPLIAALALAGCAANNQPPRVSANPIQTLNNIITPSNDQILVTDLQDTKFNLDQAIAIGVLPATDPVDACVTSVITEAGITVPGGTPSTTPSFQPKVSAPISFSAASYLYILGVQAKGLAGNAASLVPAPCQQIIGALVINTLNKPVLGAVGAISAQLPGGK